MKDCYTNRCSSRRQKWILPLVWAAIPALNAAVLTRVPMPATVPDAERTSLRSLLGAPALLLALALMAMGGASELTMSQWSSFFGAEIGRASCRERV